MSDLFALVDARGRAAATAVRRNVAARPVPAAPEPSRAGRVRPALMAAAAVLLVVGLVAVTRRDPAPANGPAALRFVVGDPPEGWTPVSTKDVGVQHGPDPLPGFNVLYGAADDPTAPAVLLSWVNPELPLDQRPPSLGFGFLSVATDVHQFDVQGRSAGCGTLPVGSLICAVDTAHGFVQVRSSGVGFDELAQLLDTVEFADGPRLAEAALPEGVSLLFAGDSGAAEASGMGNSDSAAVASVTYRGPDGRTGDLTTGWLDEQELAFGAFFGTWQSFTIDGDRAYWTSGDTDSSVRVILVRDRRAFTLRLVGDLATAEAMVGSARRASDREWTSIHSVAPPEESPNTTGTAPEAPADTASLPTLDPAVTVTDLRVDQTITQNTPDDASLSVRLPEGEFGGASVAIVGDRYAVRTSDGPGGGGTIDIGVNLTQFGTSTLPGASTTRGVVVTTGGLEAATLRVTGTEGTRYLVDLVAMPNHPALRFAMVALPSGSVVGADVIDAAGNVVASI
jgi:hypothetical protein